jgi:hypothetical protein
MCTTKTSKHKTKATGKHKPHKQQQAQSEPNLQQSEKHSRNKGQIA